MGKIIANRLNEAGRSLGWVSAVDREGRTIWIVDAHGYWNSHCANVGCSWRTGEISRKLCDNRL